MQNDQTDLFTTYVEAAPEHIIQSIERLAAEAPQPDQCFDQAFTIDDIEVATSEFADAFVVTLLETCDFFGEHGYDRYLAIGERVTARIVELNAAFRAAWGEPTIVSSEKSGSNRGLKMLLVLDGLDDAQVWFRGNRVIAVLTGQGDKELPFVYRVAAGVDIWMSG